jgi:hypothetical protein
MSPDAGLPADWHLDHRDRRRHHPHRQPSVLLLSKSAYGPDFDSLGATRGFPKNSAVIKPHSRAQYGKDSRGFCGALYVYQNTAYLPQLQPLV